MTPEHAIANLIRGGAAMTPLLGSVPVPVGLVRQIGPARWFWWAAGGETEFDGHVIEADRVTIHHGGLAVEFTRGGKFAGYLTTLPESFDDQAGQDAAAKILQEWRTRYGQDAGLRGFIERRIAEAH